MNRLLYTLLLILFSLGVSAQTETDITKIDIPALDTINRTVLHLYDYRIVEYKNNYFTVEYKDKERNKGDKSQLTGRFRFVDSNSLGAYIELINGVATGTWQYYSGTLQGSIIRSMVSFIDGYKHGTEYTYSYEWNKDADRFVSYVSGVFKYDMGKQYYYVNYWENGSIMSQQSFDDVYRWHGPYVFMYKDGTIKTEGQYDRNRPCGLWKYYNSDGNIKEEIRYGEDGTIYEQTFHRNGNPRIKKATRYRVYEGDYLFLAENGDTLTYHNYKNGIEQGYQIVGLWDNSRESYNISRYYTNEEGVIQGNYTQHYFESGRLQVKGQYNDEGIRDGVWEYYVEDGRLYRRENIENGDVKFSYTRQLENKRGWYITANYHLQQFRTGKLPKSEDTEPPLFLFSE